MRKDAILHAAPAVLGLVVLAAVGCSIEGPTTEGLHQVPVSIEGRLPGADGKAVPPGLDELLRRTDRLTAMVTVQRLDAAGRPAGRVGGGILRDITLDEASSFLRFAGVVDLEPELAGDAYRLSLRLRALGEDVAGEYQGRLALASGISVYVDSLHIGTLEPRDAGGLGTRDLALCLTSSALSSGEECVHSEDLGTDGLVYDPETNVMSFDYRRSDVVWEGSEELRTIHVALAGGLLPVVILEGAADIGPLVPGSPDPVEVEIHLAPPAGETRGPGRPGEMLGGGVLLEFEDGLPPRETGTFSLVRTEPL